MAYIEVLKPFLRKLAKKLLTTLNVGFAGYEISEFTHKNDELIVYNVTNIIEKEAENSEIKTHTWIVLVFVVIITIISIIKLCMKKQGAVTNARINETIPWAILNEKSANSLKVKWKKKKEKNREHLIKTCVCSNINHTQKIKMLDIQECTIFVALIIIGLTIFNFFARDQIIELTEIEEWVKGKKLLLITEIFTPEEINTTRTTNKTKNKT